MKQKDLEYPTRERLKDVRDCLLLIDEEWKLKELKEFSLKQLDEIESYAINVHFHASDNIVRRKNLVRPKYLEQK